ncbi:MAG: hypothetical protein WDO56_29115 [Gammaproteobacteria bacterium]
MKTHARWLIAALFFTASALAVADDRAYTEGSVVEVTYIRTRPGMFDEYMKWVGSQRKQEMEAMKKAGVILSYAVYAPTPRSPQEPDLILTVEYKNMAALDNLNEKVDPIDAKIFGSIKAADQSNIDRGKLREVLGSEIVRELKLK